MIKLASGQANDLDRFLLGRVFRTTSTSTIAVTPALDVELMSVVRTALADTQFELEI